MHPGAFEREEAEVDRIAEEQAVDRFRDEAAETDIAQRARRRPARPGAEIAAADDDVAGRIWSTQPGRLAANTARACSASVAVNSGPGNIRSVLMSSPNFQTRPVRSSRMTLSRYSPASAMLRRPTAEAATVAGEAM